MKLSAAVLPKSHQFCARKAALKRELGVLEPLTAFMGSLNRSFSFDSRCPRRPRIDGIVVASLSVSRQREGILQVYGVRESEYGSEARADFESVCLPRMRRWFQERVVKPETAILGVEEMLVEWTGTKHREHQLRYL